MNSIVRQDMQEIERRGGDWGWLTGKTVMITGSYGMLASYMVFFLIYLNETYPDMQIKIVAQGRSAEKMRSRFGSYVDRPYFVANHEDICKPIEILGPVDYIVHAASLASPQYYSVNPVGTLLPNCVGMYYLLELAREKETQGFLFFSSGDVYGALPEAVEEVFESTCGEVDPIALRSCYGESKRIGETMCKAWSHQYGVPAKSVRISHTYGPTCDPEHDERIFSEFVNNVLHGKNIIIKSDGLSTRAFCYLTDATDAFFRVLRSGQPGEAYNMANSECVISVRELAELLVRCFPEKSLRVIMGGRPAGSAYMESPVKETKLINTDKLRTLGWRPEIGVEEGFHRTIASFEEMGVT